MRYPHIPSSGTLISSGSLGRTGCSKQATRAAAARTSNAAATTTYSPPGPGNLDDKRPYKSAAIPGTNIVTSPLGPIYAYHFDGNATYHALVTRLEKRFSGGFTLLTSYTFSKAIGDTCGNAASGNATNCGFQDLRNLRVERSLDSQ